LISFEQLQLKLKSSINVDWAIVSVEIHVDWLFPNMESLSLFEIRQQSIPRPSLILYNGSPLVTAGNVR
jgi:hypothetical protein